MDAHYLLLSQIQQTRQYLGKCEFILGLMLFRVSHIDITTRKPERSPPKWCLPTVACHRCIVFYWAHQQHFHWNAWCNHLLMRCILVELSFTWIGPQCYKSGKVPVFRTDGYTVITSPSFKCCLFLVLRNRPCLVTLVKRRLSAMRFSYGVNIKSLKIYRSPWFSILFRTNDHVVAPCDEVTKWNRLNDI